VWNPDAGGATARDASAMSFTALRMWVRSVPPLGLDGVPTQTSETSAPARAARGSVVACSAPDATAFAISSSRPGSTTGRRPCAIGSTFAVSTSTPHTSWPLAARQAAVTDPT
jgi:hypothetical protein